MTGLGDDKGQRISQTRLKVLARSLEQKILDDEIEITIEFIVGLGKQRAPKRKRAKGHLEIVMHFDEHPPPHFAVRYVGAKVRFEIETCERLAHDRGFERNDRSVREWWIEHRCELAKTWNETRPSDCRAGAVSIPREWKCDQTPP